MFINKDYETLPLDSLVSSFNGLWTGKKPPFVEANVIRNTNFTMDGKLDLTDIAKLNVEEKMLNVKRLQMGDIIIEKSGGSQTQAVGRVVIFDIETDEVFSFSNFTSCLRIKSRKILPVYLHAFLNYFYQQGKTFEYQSGMTQLKNLDLKRYLKIDIKIPPIELQKEYYSYTKLIDKLRFVIFDS